MRLVPGMLLLAVAALGSVRAEEAPPEHPVTGASGYIQYWPGELPVVLAAPHGGRLQPKEMPNRMYGRIVRDEGTMELAFAIRSAMQKRFGRAPHLVACQLARVKLDCNRELREAAQGSAVGRRAWEEHHGFLREAEAAVMKTYGRGLFLDVHGHSHDRPLLELGYLLSKEEIQWPDQRLEAPEVAARSSVRLLTGYSGLSLPALVRGSTSLGALLEQRGIPTVPSPSSRLEKEDAYFTGGYSTLTHGSSDGAGLDAIQMESPRELRDTPEGRQNFARALAEALDTYFSRHYGLKLAEPAATR